MRRKIDETLNEWAHDSTQSPLLIRGARRVGKTYAIKRLGNEVYGDPYFIYCDFQTDLDRLEQVFSGTTDIERIIESLQLLYKKKIDKDKTLIAFDEIQLSGKALNALRFFAESQYKVIASGSQLGLTLKNRELPFPSDVRHVYLRPMDFEEYLWALGEESMAQGIRASFERREKFLLHEEALKVYRTYLVVGGMPKAVRAFTKEYSESNSGREYEAARVCQAEILETYTADIALYASPSETARIQAVWASIPSQISRETSRKFKYADIGKGAREKQYRGPLAWLEAAELALVVNQTNETEAPLVARGDGSFFKVYLSDVGLLYKRFSLDPDALLVDVKRQTISGRFMGALAENYVEQSLVANGLTPFYWVPKTGAQAEIEFVLQNGMGDIIPIEVKAGKNVSSSSLKRYMEKSHAPYAIHISEKNFGCQDNIFSVPLYAAFCIERSGI